MSGVTRSLCTFEDLKNQEHDLRRGLRLTLHDHSVGSHGWEHHRDKPVGRAYALVQPPSGRSSVIPEPTKTKEEQVEVIKVYLEAHKQAQQKQQQSLKMLSDEVSQIQEVRYCLKTLREQMATKNKLNGWKVSVPFRKSTPSAPKEEAKANGQEVDGEAERTELRQATKRYFAQLEEVEAKHKEEKDRLQAESSSLRVQLDEQGEKLRSAEDSSERRGHRIEEMHRLLGGMEQESSGLRETIRRHEEELHSLRSAREDSQSGYERARQLEKELAVLKEKIHHLDDMLKSQQRKVRHMIEQLQNSRMVIQERDRVTDLPQIKEQGEELSSSELGLKQEPEDPQLYSADGENNRNGDTVVDWNPEEPLQESEVKIPVITSVVSDGNSDLSLYAGVSQSQELKENKCENSKSTRRKRKDPNRSFHKSQSDEDRNVAVPKSNTSFTDDRHSKKSKYESKVQKHRKSHVGKNVSKTLEFSSRGTASQRKTIHTAKKPHVCQECGKSFSQKSDLIVHNRTHTGEKPFVCLTCGRRFSRKDHLREHEGIHTGERPHVCQECNKSFSVRTSLTRHIKVHTGEKSHVCQECNQTFSVKTNLIRHINIHTGERPFVCQTCGKNFRLKTSLKLHERTHKVNQQLFSAAVENHSRDPTVDCHPEESIAESEVKTPVSISAVSEANSELQQRSLSPAVSQSQAQRKGERETGKNPLVCKTDRCKLLSPGPLLGDKVIHTVKKPHVCQECGKSFVRKSYLIEHKRVHTGERPFVCQTCGKSFTQRSSLNHHKRLHTGGKTCVYKKNVEKVL